MRISLILTQVSTELDLARDSVLPWFTAPESSMTYRPTTGGWTIQEVLEHIVLTSKFLIILIEKGAKKALKNTQERNLAEELTGYQLNSQALDEIGLHKAFAWMRPDHMEPTGKAELVLVKKEFLSQLERCKEILTMLPEGEGLLYKTTMSVNDIGKLDVYQYIYFLAKHAQRHVTQMEKNREDMYSSL